jgi:hypothetical protein
MLRFLGGCAGRVVAVAALVVFVVVAWSNRHTLGDAWDRIVGGAPQVTPELAAQADAKLTSLGETGGPERIALDASELQSLIAYRWSGFLPDDIVDPTVEVSDGRVTLEAGVATARFGRIDELREILQFLPDTAALRAVASFVPLGRGQVVLEVHELGAAGIPVPGRLIPVVLGRFRGSPAPAVGPNTITVPLPPGIRSVYVSGDSLVFTANRAEGG